MYCSSEVTDVVLGNIIVKQTSDNCIILKSLHFDCICQRHVVLLRTTDDRCQWILFHLFSKHEVSCKSDATFADVLYTAETYSCS